MVEFSEATSLGDIPSKEQSSQISEPLTATTDLPTLEFNPDTMRKTKPGLKRFFIILSVLSSFIFGLPFLLKSIEIYRSPLPFQEIDSFSTSIQSSPWHLPCRFQAVFIGFDHKEVEGQSNADKLGFLILDHIEKLTGDDQICGGCGNNYSVSVTIQSGAKCIRNSNSGTDCLWQCGTVDYAGEFDDEGFDDLLDSALQGDGGCSNLGGKVYTVVVLNKNVETRIVVGKHRHGWMVGNVAEMEAVPMISSIFVKYFMNGGKEEGLGHDEFMPVGADGWVVLSFSLLNADPRDWIYDWDFQKINDVFLSQVVRVSSSCS